MIDDEWGDPGNCAECGAPAHWVRPGKTQLNCRCWTKCHKHGLGAIAYHPENEFEDIKNLSGYYCVQCEREFRANGPADV